MLGTVLKNIWSGRSARITDIQGVAQNHLCCGCGVCAYLAPERVTMDDFQDFGRRPVVHPEAGDDDEYARAFSACVGLRLTMPENAASGCIAALRQDWGPVLKVWEGWASDQEIRYRASSGGVITGLGLYALQLPDWTGVLHTAADPQTPYGNRTVFSKNRADLLAAAGSRYSPASPCDGLAEIADAPGRCVFVGKPCDVAAVRNACREVPALEHNCQLLISLFCAGTPSWAGTFALCRQLGCNDPAMLQSVKYRGEGWPGMSAIAFCDGGQIRKSETTYDDAWGNTLQKYRAWRCRVCPDHSGEFADIAVGDPWYTTPQQGDYGKSLILARTERGRLFVENACQAGYLELKELASQTVEASQRALLEVRGRLWGQTLAGRCLGTPIPQLQGFALFAAWKKLTWRQKLSSILGTWRRSLSRGLLRPERQE